MKKLEVRWIDPSGIGGWVTLEEARRNKPVVCTTAGYLLEDAKDHIVVASTICSNGKTSDITSIPKAVIQAKKELPSSIKQIIE